MKLSQTVFGNKRRAVSLVVTLLCLVVLTIIVIAFLQSMTLERKTAVSYSNILRAQLAADAAQVDAVGRLAEAMTKNPYHAIGYTNVMVGSTNQLFTVLLGAPTTTNSPTTYFLCSSANPAADYTALAAVPLGLNSTNSTSINRKTTDDAGWMGSPLSTNSLGSTTLVYRECRAPWVYIKRDPTKAHDSNPASANYNPYVARYAWWVEDETSKVDVTLAGNNLGSSGAFKPVQATNLVNASSTVFQDAPILSPSQVDLGAIPIHNSVAIPINSAALNSEYVSFRTNIMKLPHDGRILCQAIGGAASEKTSRFYTTTTSIANDLAGNGMRRVNINALVHDESDNAKIIASDVDDIAFAISGTHLFPQGEREGGYFYNESNTGNALLPDFGERFWPISDNRLETTGFTNEKKRRIYLAKVAANIRDYVDGDSNPTFIDKDGKVFAGSPPGGNAPPAIGIFPSTYPGDSRHKSLHPQAIGKEAIPYLCKHAWSFGSTTTDLTFDQFFSFFNPSTKDFVAPPGSFLRCFQRMSWNTGGFGQKLMQPFELDISGKTFPAGLVTVVTTSTSTATDCAWVAGGYSISLGGPGPVIRLPIRHSPPGTDIAGTLQAEEGTRRFSNVISGGAATLVTHNGGEHDWYTQMVWGNSHGYYGGYGAITQTKVGEYGIDGPNQRKSTFTTLRGNDAASHSGDPRSLEEPLALNDPYLVGTADGDQDQYRFYSDKNVSSPISVLASARNDQYLIPSGNNAPWPDYTPYFNDTLLGAKDTSYAIIRDEPMTSVGELGNIYDPYRRNGNNTAGNNNSGYIDYARGGGRTLRVGQPDDVIVDGTGQTSDFSASTASVRFSAKWRNAAWRLTDVFDVVVDANGVNRTNAAVPAQSAGKINVNSVLRDNGRALSATLRRITYLSKPFTAPNVATKTLSDDEIYGNPYGNANGLIPQIRAYLMSKGPMMERGELSQIAFFANGIAGGQAMSTTMDRGREEIFRRILPMLTTRSSAFSVYAVGQAVREDSSGKIFPLSEALEGRVHRLDPVIGNQPLDRPTAYTSSMVYKCF